MVLGRRVEASQPSALSLRGWRRSSLSSAADEEMKRWGSAGSSPGPAPRRTVRVTAPASQDCRGRLADPEPARRNSRCLGFAGDAGSGAAD